MIVTLLTDMRHRLATSLDTPLPRGGQRVRRLPLAGALLVAAGLLTACESDSESGSLIAVPAGEGAASASFEPPEAVLLTRAIVEENLELAVEIDGRPVEVTRETDGRWQAAFTLPRNRVFTVTITWFERYEGQNLVLATAEETYTVPSDGRPFEVQISERQFQFPNDDERDENGVIRDRVSNLDERRDGTDPFDFNDPGGVILLVPLTVDIALPSPLQGADSALLDALDTRLVIDGREVPVQPNGSGWQGIGDVVQESSVLVSVAIFSGNDRRIPLATARRGDIDTGGTAPRAVLAADAYQIRNDDGDALTNIEEVIGGSNPVRLQQPHRRPLLDLGVHPRLHDRFRRR